MKKINIKNKCREIRLGFLQTLADKLDRNSGWLHDHITNCPRCQRRIGNLGRVNLAFSLIKTQPHNLDLLMRANTQAINVLKHSLRTVTKAEKLKKAKPELSWSQKHGKHLQPLLNTAACLAVILLIKIGIFSSMNSFQKQGKTAVKYYCTKHLDQETVNDIFTA